MIDTKVRTIVSPELIAAIEEIFAEDGPGPKRKTWTFINNKGGVGKTFDVVALAHTLAVHFGLHILIVDMDPQANATRRCGYQAHAIENRPTLSEALKVNTPNSARGVRVPVKWEGVDVAGGSIDLLPSKLELEVRAEEASIAEAVSRIEEAIRYGKPHLAPEMSPILADVVGSLREPRKRLKTVFGDIADDYDLILIDCPPSLGHLTQNAYTASDGVLLCVKPDYDSVNGALRTYRVLQSSRAALEVPYLDIHGVLVTDIQRTGAAKSADGFGTYSSAEASLRDLRSTFKDLLWEPLLQRKAVLADNIDRGLPVTDGLGARDLEYTLNVLINWSAKILEASIG